MNKNNITNESVTSERASFIVGLFAALLALYPFKETAQKTELSLFSWSFSLYTLSGIFLLLLFFAAYFYGLNNIRYSLDKLISFKWLKFIEILAHIFYILAFIFPIVVLLVWIASLFFSFINPFLATYLKLTNETMSRLTRQISVISNIFASTSVLFSIVFARHFFKLKEKEQLEKLYKLKKYYNNQLEKTHEAEENTDYRIKILALFQTLLATIESVLTKEIGLGVKRMPTRRVIQIAQERGLITQQELSAIMDLSAIRNQVAHNLNSSNITKEQIDNLENIITQTIKRVEKMENLRHS